MNAVVTTLKEWVNPNWVRRRAVPPLDAGLRPNDRLDEALSLLPAGDCEPDDVDTMPRGGYVFSSGTSLLWLRDGRMTTIAEFGQRVSALTRYGEDIVIAVEGLGLAVVDSEGKATVMCGAADVTSCVTALTALPDGSILVTIGSSAHTGPEWARALATGDRSGAVAVVRSNAAQIVAERLAWPSGVAAAGSEHFVVSLSFEHRIERRRTTDPARAGEALVTNAPAYPGRLRECAEGWWVTMPYLRNRATELVLGEPQLAREMVETIVPEEWLVPKLRNENPYTSPLQMGQLRVHGVLKPWAPPRAYGLVALLGRDGRFRRSYHSRVGGTQHGVTGVAVTASDVVVASHGGKSLLLLPGREE